MASSQDERNDYMKLNIHMKKRLPSEELNWKQAEAFPQTDHIGFGLLVLIIAS